MDVDEIYTQIGEFGPLQRIYFFSLAAFNLYAPFNLIQIVFTGESPSFTCMDFNGTELENECPGNAKSNCKIVTYNPLPDTFAREWGLICDESYKTNLIQCIFMAGVMLGALAFGPAADKFGRKITLGVTTLGIIISGLASTFMPYYYLYAIARFFTGFFSAGNMISGFVLASELVGPSKRGLCGNIFEALFAVGIIAYSILGYWVRNWRNLSLISSSLGGIFLITFMWLPESPRWLLTHWKLEEAMKLLNQIANSNGKIIPVGTTLSAGHHVEETDPMGLKHIFRRPRICVITLIQLFSWFTNSVVYYGLTLAAGSLGSNIYMSEAMSGAIELPGCILTTLLIEWIGRIIPLAGFMIIGGIACMAVKWSENPFLPLLGKLAISGSFSIIYIHSAELFPTVVRNSGIGLCSCFARIGGIVSPLTTFANSWTSSGQFLILGGLSFSSGVLNLWLPETLTRPMPETIQDLESLLSGYSELHGDGEFETLDDESIED